MPDHSPTLDSARRAAIVRNLQYGGSDVDTSHDMYAEDAVLEFPQSGERFVGRETFKEWRSRYPAKVEYRLRRIIGNGDVWVNELLVSYNGGPWSFGVAVVVFRGEEIVRESIYVMDGWDAAEWRAPWATRFDPLAGISPADWREGEPFGLDAEAAEVVAR